MRATINLNMLEAIREWAEDLSSELDRSEVLPCLGTGSLGDCINRQRYFLVEEMKIKKMCSRCQIKWYSMMVSKGLHNLYSIKTQKDKSAIPDFT